MSDNLWRGHPRRRGDQQLSGGGKRSTPGDESHQTHDLRYAKHGDVRIGVDHSSQTR